MAMILRGTLVILISAFVLTGCQTADLSNQRSKAINMPTLSVNLDSDGDGVLDELDECPGTPENVVVDERGCPVATGPMTNLKMEYRAFFAKGSSELFPEYQLELDKVAEQMSKHDTATMKIEAHASEDEIEKDPTSILQPNSLPKNRALMVKNYLLLKHGIDPIRLSTSSCDARSPIAPSDTEEGKSFNRRVYGLVTEPEDEVVYQYQDYSNSNVCIEF